MFSNVHDEVLVSAPTQVDGGQFTIEKCTDCILLVLDKTASISIDGCRNCIMVIGPCRGSIFMRDSTNCVIHAASQQFRTRDLKNIEARLYCTSGPIIEESTRIEFSPLLMNYDGIDKHMADSCLSPFANQWFRVHNVTPESSKFTLTTMHFDSKVPTHSVISEKLSEKFRRMFQKSPHGLTFDPDESYFYNVSFDKLLGPYEERAIILIKSLDDGPNAKSMQELYNEARQVIREIFRYSTLPIDGQATKDSVRLIHIQDMTLKPGDYEKILQLKMDHKTPGGKIIIIEFAGVNARSICNGALTPSNFVINPISSNGDSNGNSVRPQLVIVDATNTEFYRSQLYQYCHNQRRS
ncbi:tubulin binding cofactor C domain-containing protein [Ditylenchus destructor]|uniref:Tubulin binding cofactor C domain-containing protein n=1 Tax=Ditylenchus destructor TaxID=166010 RepID=A0AAD4R2J7_9BILA|nr:tubulin binding cofactor C domain-containing protein [Ditylenchus destructor]